MLQGYAIFLIPTQAEAPSHYLMTIPKYPNIGYTCIFRILGNASTNILAGFSQGVPIGIQAISLPFQDHLTLRWLLSWIRSSVDGSVRVPLLFEINHTFSIRGHLINLKSI
ncbi:hypothetical protein JTE90_009580 [Oedothorax gibbosus]|uniref:Uncharacterized protein n=1 Tax=Oedothorax gibbosus TaxID=931172 RepID=A0AAV6VHX4_9ARAC|nr:hypothetical protein JTE90_009580 [Oedothorax gibbosus]